MDDSDMYYLAYQLGLEEQEREEIEEFEKFYRVELGDRYERITVPA